MRFEKYLLVRAGGLVLLGLSFANCGQAALQVYEGFNYADGTNLRTQTGGIGWADGWQNTGDATETATMPGLTYTGLGVTGNKATIAGEQDTVAATGSNAFLFRNLTQTFGTDGTTTWVSVIGQRTGEKSMGGTSQPLNYQRVFSTAFFNVVGTTATEQFSVGELSVGTLDVWGLNAATDGSQTQNTTVPIDTQAFLLLKIEHLAGNDNASLWVNPNLSLGEAGLGAPAAAISDDMTFNRIRIQAGGSQNTGATFAASGLWDEIRIGTAFADVTPGAVSQAGDFDLNGKVDAADYVFWRENIGTDGKYLEWRTNFGVGIGPGAAAGNLNTIPEPATLALVTLAAALFVRRRSCSTLVRPTQ